MPTQQDVINKIKQLGLSVARGVPQAATGMVDLAALPFTMSGLLAPDQVVGSTDWMTRKGYLPPAQPGLLNETAELTASLVNPLSPIGKVTSRALAPLTQKKTYTDAALAAYGPGVVSNVLPPKKYQGKLLEGLPPEVDMGGGRMEAFGTDQRIVDIAKQYMADKGLRYVPQDVYAVLDKERGKRIANAYEAAKDAPSDPKVRKAYQALADETAAQYEALRKAGYKFDFMDNDIYGNPRNAINDLILNKRMSVFPTEQGFGTVVQAADEHPLLKRTGETWNGKPVTYNDLFRAVHDAFGHAKHGVGFRARGEENAYQAHARMYSPEALPAAASELRGQNSTVNFGKFGEANQKASPADTVYADQKTVILPDWAIYEGLLGIPK